MYLTNYTRSNIAFLVNLRDIVLYQLKDIGIKSIMYYDNMGLCYSKLFKYVDIDYLSDPHKTQSQMRYVFIYDGMTISWRSIKQIMKTCGLPSIRGNATNLIMLYALHILTNDTLRVIESNIYHPSLLLSLTPEK